ncbi:MAG: hypothetical protein ACOXZ0_05215 [Eubacteriales bacterium]
MAARAGYAIGNGWLREVKTVRDIQSAEGYQFGNKRKVVGVGQICLRERDIQRVMGKGWLGRTGQICMGYLFGGGKEKARKGCGCYRCLRAVMWRLLRWIKRDYARRFSADKLPMGCCGE